MRCSKVWRCARTPSARTRASSSCARSTRARRRRARARAGAGATPPGCSIRCGVRVVRGKGSYVCGEETALLNAIEGRRGEVRLRPPWPAQHGLSGRPTVVNNVETLVNVPWIARAGRRPTARSVRRTPPARR